MDKDKVLEIFSQFYDLLDRVAENNGGDTLWASDGTAAHEALIDLAEQHNPLVADMLLARLDADSDLT